MNPVSTPQAAPRNTLGTRLAICLFVGVVVFWGTFGTVGFVEKLIRDGSGEAAAGMMRAIAELTVSQCVRLIGLAMGLSLIACFPAYVTPTPASLMPLLLCAGLAAIMLAGCFSFEAWYWFGHLSFPPPGLLVALALVALVSAVASRAAVAQLQNGGRMR
jgi:hypothetical protein